jgi:hypothetical protein
MGLSPDNGGGSVEAFILVFFMAVAVVTVAAHPRIQTALGGLLWKAKGMRFVQRLNTQ